MSYTAIKNDLQDVAFTLATPFSDDTECVLHDHLKKNIKAIEAGGGSLFIPCGNTGEYHALSHEERVEVVETTVAATRDDSTVIAGAGGNTKAVIRLLEEYATVGADGGMVMMPPHTYYHERGIKQHYHEIAESTDLPLVLYKRGPKLSDAALAELSEVNNIVGVKYAVNDINAFSEVVGTADGDVVWMNGIAERFTPAFSLEGAEGFTTGIGNFVPRPTLELMVALKNEEWDRAKSIRDSLRSFENLRDGCGQNNSFSSANNVPSVKFAMDLAGLYGGPVRSPLVKLAGEDQERARKYYQRIVSEFDTTTFE